MTSACDVFGHLHSSGHLEHENSFWIFSKFLLELWQQSFESYWTTSVATMFSPELWCSYQHFHILLCTFMFCWGDTWGSFAQDTTGRSKPLEEEVSTKHSFAARLKAHNIENQTSLRAICCIQLWVVSVQETLLPLTSTSTSQATLQCLVWSCSLLEINKTIVPKANSWEKENCVLLLLLLSGRQLLCDSVLCCQIASCHQDLLHQVESLILVHFLSD
jgi:hypothetical protein